MLSTTYETNSKELSPRPELFWWYMKNGEQPYSNAHLKSYWEIKLWLNWRDQRVDLIDLIDLNEDLSLPLHLSFFLSLSLSSLLISWFKKTRWNIPAAFCHWEFIHIILCNHFCRIGTLIKEHCSLIISLLWPTWPLGMFSWGLPWLLSYFREEWMLFLFYFFEGSLLLCT